jgi:hypothetical protein
VKVIQLLLVLDTYVQKQKLLYFPRNQTSARAMVILIFTVVAVISQTVHGPLPTTKQEYPLMHYTKLVSEEHFTPECPLLIVLPLAEKR